MRWVAELCSWLRGVFFFSYFWARLRLHAVDLQCVPPDVINQTPEGSGHVRCDKFCSHISLLRKYLLSASRRWPAHVHWSLATADICWKCSQQLLPAWHLLALKFISRHCDICVQDASHIKGIFVRSLAGKRRPAQGLLILGGGGQEETESWAITFFLRGPQVRLGDS